MTRRISKQKVKSGLFLLFRAVSLPLTLAISIKLVEKIINVPGVDMPIGRFETNSLVLPYYPEYAFSA